MPFCKPSNLRAHFHESLTKFVGKKNPGLLWAKFSVSQLLMKDRHLIKYIMGFGFFFFFKRTLAVMKESVIPA